ncbi:MAG: GPI mannosyltransferase 1 [Caeruleum heppii]|nr:MAG: GPI mannosyltransferase 1 [Caeruleum heppii]
MFRFLSDPSRVFALAILLRIIFLFYGQLQDAYSPVKYTDIDYYVFTDAARFVSRGRSPYERDTYRYTPLLAWLIVPSTWRSWSFPFGKILFASADIAAGWLIKKVLCSAQMPKASACKYAAVWLLNPMVATISTRGSSEGLLGVMVMAIVWAATGRRPVLAGILLGLAVHFKIYPVIYAPAILWWMDDQRLGRSPPPPKQSESFSVLHFLAFFNPARIAFTVASLLTFVALNQIMYSLYGWPFVQHTFLHHLIRIDHRHNFSIYNTLLHLHSSGPPSKNLPLESMAFLPQLLLSAVIIPICLAKKNLTTTMLAQTFAFVTFNKVCTSQYFLWFMVLLPLYLPDSTLLRYPRFGIGVALSWIVSQGLWLQQAYRLEFLGFSTFVPQLWAAATVFLVVNLFVLKTIVSDVGGKTPRLHRSATRQ